eukprot:2320334-Alexandrium_andersonii.AAC.1
MPKPPHLRSGNTLEELRKCSGSALGLSGRGSESVKKRSQGTLPSSWLNAIRPILNSRGTLA